jgi:tRNA threonylcarbamoyladenosine biosynthesis protein TsaB
VTRPRLGIDTATDRATVAIGDAGRVWEHAVLEGARRQAGGLLGVVDDVLRRAGVRIPDVAAILVGDGPGSFTGLRVGWSLARGLAQERGLPLFAVPSLLAHARSAALAAGIGNRPVAACFDALRGQVFGAVYRFDGPRVDTVVAPALLTVTELSALAGPTPAVTVGDGAERYADEIVRWTGAAPFRLGLHAPPVAWSLIVLAAEGRSLSDPATAEPVYGRPAEAQARWEARHGRPLPHPPR